MNVLLIIITLIANPIDIGKIGKINAAKAAARKAYQSGNYEQSAKEYQYLVDSLGVREDEVLMNLAHSRLNLGDTTAAMGHYQAVSGSKNGSLRSDAFQQLGVIKNRQAKPEEALDDFRQALRANPSNAQARHNYELVKKKLDDQKKQDQQKNKDKQNNQKDDKKDQDQQKQDQQKKDQDQKGKDQEKKESQNKEQKDGEKKDQEQQQKDQQDQENQQKPKDSPQQLDPEKMKNMKMTEDKARMILEALKSNEVQYLQQNKRKATKPKDKNKPDW